MAKFDADTLSDLRDVQEVAIRTEKHPASPVVIWVVVADEEVFVRSVRGSKGRWYRDLATGGPAELEFAGRRLGVQALPAGGVRSPGPAANICGSISRAPTRSPLFATRFCQRHCGWNRADQPDPVRLEARKNVAASTFLTLSAAKPPP